MEEAKKNEIVVDNVENDPTDVSTNDIVEKEISTEEKKESDEKQKMVFEKYNPDEIDWDKIEYAPEDVKKLYPIVSEEDINIFTTITDNIIDRDTIEIWMKMAKDDITEYASYLELKEQGQLDEEDLKYFEALTESSKRSQNLLAIIQQQSRSIAKSFEEDKLYENTIKAISLNTLKDFIVRTYRYSNVPDKNVSDEELKTLDRTDFIKNEIMKKMYVLPIFREINVRNDAHSRMKGYNRFGANYFDRTAERFVSAINVYVKYSENKENIDLDAIINRDFEYMNFVTSPILYSYELYGKDKGVITEKLDDKTKDLLEKHINLNGYFVNDAIKDNNIFKEIYETNLHLISVLNNKELVNRLFELSLMELKLDPLFKYYENKSLDYKLFNEYIVAVTNDVPEIEGTAIGKWAKYYKYLMKYNRYILFEGCMKAFSEDVKDEHDKFMILFNTGFQLINYEYKNMYSNLVDKLNDYIYEEMGDKQSSEVMFKSIINSLIYQHSLGFKSEFDVKTEASGEKIYDVAKRIMGNSYDYIIIDQKDDIILENVNLIETRKSYFELIIDIMKSLVADIDYWSLNDEEFNKQAVTNGNIVVKPNKVKTGKKKTSKRRR